MSVQLITIIWHVLLTATAVYAQRQEAKGIFVDNGTNGAICLDGTSGLFYIHEGSVADKYVLFFEGGGVCSGLSVSSGGCFDTCYDRAQGHLGSTKGDPANVDLNGMGPGWLTTNANMNPLMHAWTHVFVRYCDGGFFAGYKAAPDVYQHSSIYYRGARILQAVITALQTDYGLNGATDVVISGCSAGSQAVYININVMHALIVGNGSGDAHDNAANMRLYTISDSGFIVDTNGLHGDTYMSYGQNVSYWEHNMTGNVAPQCKADNTAANQYRCIMPQYASAYIEPSVHFFALQSQFDAFQIDCVLGVPVSDVPDIQAFGMTLTSLLNDSLLLTNGHSNGNGAMIDSCRHHCGGWNQIALNGVTQCEAFTAFYNGQGNVWYQNEPYPCAPCCGQMLFNETTKTFV